MSAAAIVATHEREYRFHDSATGRLPQPAHVGCRRASGNCLAHDSRHPPSTGSGRASEAQTCRGACAAGRGRRVRRGRTAPDQTREVSGRRSCRLRSRRREPLSSCPLRVSSIATRTTDTIRRSPCSLTCHSGVEEVARPTTTRSAPRARSSKGIGPCARMLAVAASNTAHDPMTRQSRRMLRICLQTGSIRMPRP